MRYRSCFLTRGGLPWRRHQLAAELITIDKIDEFNGLLRRFCGLTSCSLNCERLAMSHLRRNRLVRRVLLASYVLAVALLGFAHQPISLVRVADLSAYALPDGSLPFICGAGKSGAGAHGGKHACAACSACLLTAAPGLLDDHDHRLPPAPTNVIAAARLDPYRAHVAADRPLGFQSRGPPRTLT